MIEKAGGKVAYVVATKRPTTLVAKRANNAPNAPSREATATPLKNVLETRQTGHPPAHHRARPKAS